jgi:TetR/AcrR family transcriptional regulator, transcriptional repressor for nem operon
MARPKAFDAAAALDSATQCFWERGYDGSSVRDLANRMGINVASLYNAFSDKRSLYRHSLEYYVDHSFRERVGRLEGHLPPLQAIGAFLSEIIERSLADPKRKGCLLVNSALELAPHDPEFEQIVAGILVQVEAFFRRCIEAGQGDGTITRAQPAEDLARLLLGTLVGLRVLARARPERELLEGMVRPVLAMLSE